MNRKKQLLVGLTLLSFFGCSTDTYVSQENIDKYDERVQKFLIAECLVPQREIQIAVAEHFEFDKSELMEADHTSLNQFINEIKKLKGRVAIVGHTDYQGSVKYNEQLSLKRAESIKAYLLQNLNAENYEWEIKYYGEKKPIAEGKTLEANAINRRAFLVFEQTVEKETNPACLPPEPKRKVYVTMASHFDFDKSILKEKDKVELDKLALKLEGLTGRILIAGHTDYQGSVSYNEKLAKERSIAVQEYLKTRVDPTQFVWEVKSFGENDPIVEEHSLKANAENRRAFVVFKEGPLPEEKIESLTETEKNESINNNE
ncbi:MULTISPECIES: OmpA family protein [Aliivibrio]|uniref:OmpA family protein n=1 Tax=Aliivibrio finisterrensis TaxID=511998 RepID=A0A4Q5KWM8_9GAMM|nr:MULTISPECIES: OmpA family protein [Aliivibrio]MDD9178465.1 OmpA family protein [Aliivibrio sp. A6]RYU52963.1 OmpA family protein [Aliivibrio finisterrensis]RYU53359.1 OmpA family protein [Aliivibrio finisterrensis]RYU58447.1 OmpA family protein [Aliivibrio finisterrensis]RYU65865.1 OmpA family protein [Aliivibrio finisterrensis]